MKEFLIWAVLFFLFLAVPLASAIWFFCCLSSFNSALPFTPERRRKKVWAIISGIFAAVTVGTFLTVVFTYGVTQFFG